MLGVDTILHRFLNWIPSLTSETSTWTAAQQGVGKDVPLGQCSPHPPFADVNGRKNPIFPHRKGCCFFQSSSISYGSLHIVLWIIIHQLPVVVLLGFSWFFGDSIEYGQMILVEFDPEMWAHERSPQTARVRSLCVFLDFTTCQM